MERNKYIGGSDIAKLAGCSQYGNETTVWLEKTGKTTSNVDNRFTTWGKKLEKTISEAFYEAHPELFKVSDNTGLKHDQYDFVGGECDGMYHDKATGLGGILEVKTTSQFKSEEWEEGKCPDAYMLQVQYYLSLTGYKEAHLVVLIGGSDYREVKIEADEKLQANLLKIAVNFWNSYVVTGICPPSDMLDADTLKALYPAEVPGKEITIDRPGFVEMLNERKAQLKELEKLIDEQENTIKTAMGDAELAIIDGKYPYKYATVTVNHKAKEAYTSSYRKLTAVKPKSQSHKKIEGV